MVSMSEYLEWGQSNISLAALHFQPQQLLKSTSEQWRARKIAASTLSSSQKPPPPNSWHLGRPKYWMPKLDELMSHWLWMLWLPKFLKVGWLFSNDLDQPNRWNSSTDAHPEAAWISTVTRERCIQGDCLDNCRPETWGTTVSPAACLHLTIAWDVNRLQMIQSFSQMGRRSSTHSISSMGKQWDNLVKSLAKINAESRKYLGIDAFNECKGWIAMDVETYGDS